MPQQGRKPSTAQCSIADAMSGSRLADAVVGGDGGTPRPGEPPVSEREGSLRPMLEAVVRLAGATGGAIRAIGADRSHLEPGIAVGLPPGMDRTDIGAIAVWCSRCDESRNSDSDCGKSGVCGSEERFLVDLADPACRHVMAIPLRHRGEPVGRLDLLFENECALRPETMPLVHAAGELIGVALETARLTRENLRVSLSNERQMMANEVHDSLAQSLTYMRMRMSLLRDAIKHGNELRAVKYWGDVDSSLTDAHRRLRELVTYFRSRMDPRGLQHALLETATSFFDKTGVVLEFENGVRELHLPVGREVQVFHIVQEALANVCKHANARRARLALSHSGDGYEIVVEDDGVGIAADHPAGDHGEVGHYGIAIMRERARRLGGELMLESAAGAGTRVRLQFPAEQPQTGSTL